MDKHRYVRKAFHGRRELSSEQVLSMSSFWWSSILPVYGGGSSVGKWGKFDILLLKGKYTFIGVIVLNLLNPFQRKMLYLSLDEPPDFRGDNWVNVDTFFGLVDCTLFAKLVEFHDSIGHMAHVDQGGLLYETANRYHGSPGRLGNKVSLHIYVPELHISC